MSTTTILLLCVAGGAVVHVFQIMTVLAWVARGQSQYGPTVSAPLPDSAEPLPVVVALTEQDYQVEVDPPPDTADAPSERVTVLQA